jgi:hypothetical protein
MSQHTAAVQLPWLLASCHCLLNQLLSSRSELMPHSILSMLLLLLLLLPLLLLLLLQLIILLRRLQAHGSFSHTVLQAEVTQLPPHIWPRGLQGQHKKTAAHKMLGKKQVHVYTRNQQVTQLSESRFLPAWQPIDGLNIAISAECHSRTTISDASLCLLSQQQL